MGRPWYPKYPADYAFDTRHLTLAEHGAYNLMMDRYYAQEEALPADAELLFSICGARDEQDRATVLRVCKWFFTEEGGKYRQKRIDEEIAKAKALSETRSKAALSKGSTKASNSRARATQLQSQSQPQSKPLASTPKGVSATEYLSVDKQGGKVQEGGANGAEHPALIDDPVVERIPLVDGSEFEVKQSFVTELDRAYPAVEPVQTLRELRAWNVANPQYRKTAAGVRRHVNAWFAKEQNRASRPRQ